MSEFEFIETDVVVPISIEHHCEEIWNGGQLEQRYNYIDYVFEVGRRRFSARSYLDNIEEVSLEGPFADSEGLDLLNEPLSDDVLAYLKRRYRKIVVLRASGYETLWEA